MKIKRFNELSQYYLQQGQSSLENAKRSKIIFRLIDSINENNVIRNGDTIIMGRFADCLSMCDIDVDLDNLEFENYKLL